MSEKKFTQGEKEEMEEELKPCPFCGGKAKISKDITGPTEVWCCNCLTNFSE